MATHPNMKSKHITLFHYLMPDNGKIIKNEKIQVIPSTLISLKHICT